MLSKTQFAVLFSTVSMIAIPGAAWAQDAAVSAAAPTDGADAPQADAPQADAPQADAPQAGLGEIIVTAQRKSENLQNAAVAVAVVSNTELVERNVTSPASLTQLVPSVQIQQAGGSATTFFVRGVGNFAVNGYTDPAVAFNYDGVYLGRSTSNGGLLYDIERVEVLKGPQGTLYGRNATSGAINVLPTKPQAGVLGGFISASYGNYDALNIQGALNVPMGDKGALRISGMRSKRDGYLSDGTSDDDTTALRVQMLANLTDTLAVRVGGDYAHVDGIGTGSSYAYSYAFNNATGAYVYTPSGLGLETGLFDPVSQAYRQKRFLGLSGRFAAPLDRAPYLNNNFYGANAEITWKSPIGTFTIIPGWRNGQLDQIFTVPAFEAYLQEKQDQKSLEVRLAGDRLGGFADYVLGAFLYRESVNGNYTFNQQALAPFTNFESITNAKALFGRLTGHLTDRLRLVGGIRYTEETKRFDGKADQIQVVCTRRVGGVPSCPNAPLIPTVDRPDQVGFAIPTGPGAIPIGTTGANAVRRITAIDASTTVHKVNYRAAVEFDVAPRSLFYVSYENGFRSGGFSLALGHETYRPEAIEAYTVGMKNRFFGNRLQLNIEGFIWKYKDQQVTHPGVDSTGANVQFTENVGRSTNKGVEVEAQFLPFPDTLIGVNAQYLDAKYDSFVFQVPVGNAPPATGCAYSKATAASTFYNVNCSGNPAYNSPKWTLNLGAQQTFHLGETDVSLRVDTQYRSSRVIGFDYLAFQTVGSTWQTGAQISVKPAGTPLTLAAFVQNIENNRIPVGSNAYGIGSVYTYNVSPPRTYGVRASAKF